MPERRLRGNVVLVAALAGELRPLVQHASMPAWKKVEAPGGMQIWKHEHRNGAWIAICAGMGSARAGAALAHIQQMDPPDTLCSVGWAGALSAKLKAGDVRGIETVVDIRTGERFASLSPGASTILATSATVADAVEKRRLLETYGADMVDMEASTIARMAEQHKVPFFCWKAVSDDFDARLPEMNRFVSTRGQLRMTPFLMHTALRPASWSGLMQLGRHSALAARRLADFMYEWLDPGAVIRMQSASGDPR